MAQFGRPVLDIVTNSWTASSGSALYDMLDEASFSDTDYIQRNAVAYCEVSLTTSLSDPQSSLSHYVRYRLGRSRTDRTLTIVVRLMQNITEIASWTHTDPELAFAAFEQTLSAGQADSITDYGDLRLRFDITALQNTQVYGQVSWAELEIPDAGASPTTAQVVLTGYQNDDLNSLNMSISQIAISSIGDHTFSGINNQIGKISYLGELYYNFIGNIVAETIVSGSVLIDGSSENTFNSLLNILPILLINGQGDYYFDSLINIFSLLEISSTFLH